MNKMQEKLHDNKIVQEIREKQKMGYQLPRAKVKKGLSNPKAYNYKIKETGDQAESIIYSQPILTGYTRKHTPERKEGRTMANEQNIKRARRNVYDIVNTNFTEYTKMITLTYAETMLDYNQLAMDWKVFMKSLKRKGITFPYLAITEHQTKRGKKEGNAGSLHIHALLFTDQYIPFKTLKESWGIRGSVHIEKIDKASNKGAYVAKYITKESAPADKKSYRTSRNIKRPTYRVGLGSEIDVIQAVREDGYEYINGSQYEYTKINGINQETGEIKEDTSAIVDKYRKKVKND